MSFVAKFLKLKRCTGCSQEWQNRLNGLPKRYSNNAPETEEENTEEFRVLRLFPRDTKLKKIWKEATPIRDVDINEKIDWTNVWVGPKSFDPYMVPLDIRQGFTEKGVPPGKYGNAELMKIPNFLHLTPPAIEKHCAAIKKFCTKWPHELITEEEMDKHFPVTIISSDYCNSLPTIRDPLARIVSLKVKLKDLKLDKHANDKFLRLVGNRYDPKTDYVTLTTENCPLKKQNYDHAIYVLTALYFESQKVEEWEELKSPEDMEEYEFPKRQCKQNIISLFAYNKLEVPDLEKMKEVTEKWVNETETSGIVESYKEAVLELLGLPEFDRP